MIDKAEAIILASELSRLGLRTAHVSLLSGLSKDACTKLHRLELGRSASKGMLPYSTDWYLAWRNNMHASLFLKLYSGMGTGGDRELTLNGYTGVFSTISKEARQFLSAYKRYRAHVQEAGDEILLSAQRAYFATQVLGSEMHLAPCPECGQLHLTYTYDLAKVCGNCFVPSRVDRATPTMSLRAQ
ncbi:FlhC family transcriptional regulator [Burkholderia gladioli]|uniref:FlhC family transcriptional regulator n=1 Tax=Burkholderia gladioli TaxID=28095 RepID=UPI003D1F8963